MNWKWKRDWSRDRTRVGIDVIMTRVDARMCMQLELYVPCATITFQSFKDYDMSCYDLAGVVTFSDDEVDTDGWADYKMPFGKYKGTHLSVMIQTSKQRSYLRYTLSWEKLRTEPMNMIKRALNEYKSLRDYAMAKRQKKEDGETSD